MGWHLTFALRLKTATSYSHTGVTILRNIVLTVRFPIVFVVFAYSKWPLFLPPIPDYVMVNLPL